MLNNRKNQKIHFFSKLLSRKTLCILAAMFLMMSCVTVSSEFKKARNIDTVVAYQEFLKKYPNSEFTKEAKKRIEELEYEKAKSENTIESYQRFIEKYPDSEFGSTAKEKIAIQKDFETAKTKNTIEAYEEFIAEHIDSDLVEEAKVKIRELSLRKKTIKDIIKVFVDHGLDGEYIPDKSPAPFIECGVFKGDKFAVVFVKFEDWETVYPNINTKARKFNIDIAVHPEEGKYKSVAHTDIGPFAIIFVIKSKSLEDKRDEILKVLEEL